MADLPVQPLANYGDLLSSYGNGQANQENAQKSRLTAMSEIPQRQAATALTQAQTTGANQQNNLAAIKIQALSNYLQSQSATSAATAAPDPGADASGVAAPGPSAAAGGFADPATAAANLDAGLSQKFRVNKAYTPPEQAQLQNALRVAAVTGDDNFVKIARQQHDTRVQTQTAQNQYAAQQVANSSYTVATAPEGTAVAALRHVHPDTFAQLAAQNGLDPDHPEQWSAADKSKMEDAARERAAMLHEKVFQYTGDTLEDNNGQTLNSRTGLPPIGHMAQGISPSKYADLATKGSELVDVPRSDGSTVKVPARRSRTASMMSLKRSHGL